MQQETSNPELKRESKGDANKGEKESWTEILFQKQYVEQELHLEATAQKDETKIVREAMRAAEPNMIRKHRKRVTK